jgi:hypothetical protein
MTDSDEDSADSSDGKRCDRLGWIDLPAEIALELPGTVLADLSDALRAGVRGGTPDAETVEAALDRASIPEVGDLDVDAVVRPGEAIPHDRADAVVENGGEAAGEATAEVIVAALEGL